MLAEIAAASAAYTTIKTAISQGRELVSVGKQIGQFVSAEEDLKAKVEKKKNSLFTKVLGKEADDFEEFLALDSLRQKKKELESHMRLYGRSGLYDDWVAYQAQMRKQRQEALKKQQKEADELRELMTWAFIIIVIWGGIGYGIYWWFFK